jgi:hypothetical protein
VKELFIAHILLGGGERLKSLYLNILVLSEDDAHNCTYNYILDWTFMKQNRLMKRQKSPM